MQKRDEVEIKFRLGHGLSRDKVEARLMQCGFERQSSQFEFDFVPDTDGYRCRANKMIVRFRRVTDSAGTRILLTFKAKFRGGAGNYVQAEESEFFLDQPDLTAWKHMNEALFEAVGRKLPDEVVSATDFVRVVELAAQAGFDHFRMMIEKERETFTRGRVVATIDKLSRDIGEFLELEAHSAAELEVVMAELALPKAPEKLDYGDIIMAYNGSNDTRGRTAVFDEATRDAIYALVKEHAV